MVPRKSKLLLILNNCNSIYFKLSTIVLVALATIMVTVLMIYQAIDANVILDLMVLTVPFVSF